MHFRKIAIVGVGLLGGSLGMALKKRRLAGEVAGFVRRAASVRECEKTGAVDFATRDLGRAVEDADLIVLCTPLARMPVLLEQMLPALQPGAIVTDVGSAKQSVVADLEPLAAFAGAHFIGSHPMAGAEKSGAAAARADLFANAVCVVTPTKRTDAGALRKVERLWWAVDCRVLRMAPAEHDRLVSRTSHLPHLIAAALAAYVLNPAAPKLQPTLCANGFRDTTRIASGSPEMWRDIVVANRDNLRLALDAFVRELQKVQALLRGRTPQLKFRDGDAAQFERFLAVAKRRRDHWCACGASPSPE